MLGLALLMAAAEGSAEHVLRSMEAGNWPRELAGEGGWSPQDTGQPEAYTAAFPGQGAAGGSRYAAWCGSGCCFLHPGLSPACGPG